MDDHLIPPTEYQKSNARLVARVLNGYYCDLLTNSLNQEEKLDVLLVNDEEAFERWDNIAADAYELLGGQCDNGTKNPVDESLFEDCQNYATELILSYATGKVES